MIVIDDVVDKATQDLIEDMVLNSDAPRWVYHRGYAAPKRIPPLAREQSSPSFFFEIVRANMNSLINPTYAPFLAPLARLNPQKIFKVRCVLHHPLREENRKCLPAHLDALPEHYETDKFKVAVYYVNDADGPTIFYKETYQSAKDNGLTDDDITQCRMEIAGEIEPKKGRLVVFDHDVYHSTGFAKNGVRSIINYNFL